MRHSEPGAIPGNHLQQGITQMAQFRNAVAARIHADRFAAPARLTALGKINDNLSVALKIAQARRDTNKNSDYQEGQAAAFNEAHKIMKAELQRLRNLLQNGSLTQADFGDDLPY